MVRIERPIVNVIFLACSVALFLMSLPNLQFGISDWRASGGHKTQLDPSRSHWQKTDGKLISLTEPKGYPVITVEYEVEEVTYKTIGGLPSRKRSELHDRKGARITVLYDPDNPSVAVFGTPTGPQKTFELVAGILGIASSVVLIFVVLFPRKLPGNSQISEPPDVE